MSLTNSQLDHPTFRWGVELTPDVPGDELATLAGRAERAGFGAAFVSSHFNNRDPFVTLGQLTRETDALALGPGVLNPYDVHPARIASAMATLDEAGDGRAILGIGAGDRSTLEKLGLERNRPVGRVAETIRVARQLWNGDQVDHQGTFGLEAASLSYPARSLPVYVGGQGPQMLRMAATVADGVLANAAHPAEYEWIAEQVSQGLENRPDHRGDVRLAAFASVSIARSAETAAAAARPPVAFIAAGTPDRVLDRHPVDREQIHRVREALAGGDHGRAYELVTPAMIDRFAIAGTVEEVAERVTSLQAHVDAIVAASPLGPDRSEAIELLGELVDAGDLGPGAER